MRKLSIIVPVYNIGKYLERCVDSILNQTFKEFELLLIDDGSVDSSPEICDKYAELDCRVIVVHKENEGVSAARNQGLDMSKGEYIGFVDADDYIAPDMFEKLIVAIEVNDADVACCDLAFIDEDENIVAGERTGITLLNGEETFARMLDTNAYLRMGVWNKLYRKSLVNEKRFLVGRHMSEDLVFLIDTVLPANKIAYVQQPLYYYFRQREGAATQKKYGVYEKQRLESTQYLVESVRSDHKTILTEAVLYKCINGDLTALNKMIISCVEDEEVIRFVKNDLRKDILTVVQSKLRLMKKIQICMAAISFRIYRKLFKIYSK